jgi:hypothetical protein
VTCKFCRNSGKNKKNVKPICSFPCEEHYNFCRECIYFWVIAFAWKIKIPRSIVLQNLHVFMSWFLDTLCFMPCLITTQKFAESFLVDRFIWIILYLWWICLDEFYSLKQIYFCTQLLAIVLLCWNASLVNLPWFYLYYKYLFLIYA